MKYNDDDDDDSNDADDYSNDDVCKHHLDDVHDIGDGHSTRVAGSRS